ncbi:hypothetical protein EP331_06580 [bacterium]|nr:MAG: hypothetical protein EP331_06580 [bacterium]
MRLFYLILVTLCFGLSSFLDSQGQIWNGSGYFTQRFSPTEYKAHSQNWQIVQDSSGIIYSANNNGVLVYDGVQFRLYETPNTSVVRSLQFAHNRIYYGAQNDFGYLEPDSIGELQFHSLATLVDSTERNFRDIWKIYTIQNDVFFYSLSGIFKWNQETISSIKPEKFFYFPFPIGNQLLVQEPGKHCSFWVNDSLQAIPGDSFFLDKPYFFAGKTSSGGMLIATETHGLFYWKDALVKPIPTAVDKLLKEGQIYHGIQLKNGNFALSTRRNGSFILSENGDVIHYLTKDYGLPSNTHWSIFEDRMGDIWISTDNEIVHVSLKHGMSIIDESKQLSGTIESLLFYKNRLLVASRDGFAVQQDDGSFYYTPEIETDVWDLLHVDDFVLIASGDGLFTWNGKTVKHAFKTETGNTWLTLYHDTKTNRYFAGTTNGLLELFRVGSSWKAKPFSSINDEVRNLFIDDKGVFWIQTRYTGIVELHENLSGDEAFTIKRYQENSPLVSNIVRIFEFNKDLFIHDNVNFYQFDAQQDTLLLNSSFRAQFSGVSENEHFHRFFQESEYSILYTILNDQYFTRIYQNDSLIVKLRTDKIPDYFNSIGFAKHPEKPIFFLGGVKNILSIDLSKKQDFDLHEKPVIRQLSTNRTQAIFRGYESPLVHLSPFQAPVKSIRFEFASAFYGLDSSVEYQFRLMGLDSTWSPFTTESYTEFTNLNHGDYQFEVRQQFPDLTISEAALFTFSVRDRWYASTWFYALISLVALVSVAFASRFVSIKPLIAKISRLEVEQKMHHERERISKELHDNIGTQLIQIVSGLELTEAYQKKEKQDKALELVHTLRDETRSTITQLRQTVWTLHTGTILFSEFLIRVQDMIQTQLKHHPKLQFKRLLKDDIQSVAEQVIIQPDTALHAFRIIQEACNNSIKYADATEITLFVDVLDSAQKRIRIRVSDNGKGFDSTQKRSGFGLNNMQQRAEQANFKVFINSEIGIGTQTEIDWLL